MGEMGAGDHQAGHGDCRIRRLCRGDQTAGPKRGVCESAARFHHEDVPGGSRHENGPRNHRQRLYELPEKQSTQAPQGKRYSSLKAGTAGHVTPLATNTSAINQGIQNCSEEG